MADLLDTLNDLRDRLNNSDAEILDRLTNAYLLTVERINPLIETLAERLDADSEGLTAAQVKRLPAYRALMDAIEQELDDYESYLKTEVRQAANSSAAAGLDGGQALLLAALALAFSADEIPADVLQAPGALDFLGDYLAPDGELFRRIDGLSSFHAQQIADGILERVALGQNPRKIADWITDAYGMPLSDSLRTARTVQLYSYRQAENQTFGANSDLLEGVVWVAELDDRVCMSCVSLHGQVFPVGTIANDHHNGRCAMIPLIKGEKNPVTQSGAEWFGGLSEAQQRSMMGPGKFEAWQGGKFELSQLTATHTDDVYGEMRIESSLKDLVGSD